MPDGLRRIVQDDFSQGAFRAVARHLISQRGTYSLQNLLLDDDGSLYKRGGSVFLSTSAFGSSLRWVWDGFLAGGQRTVFANPDDFGVLDAAEAPLNLGESGLAFPVPVAVLGGVMFIGGGTMYAGSRKTANYSAGTVSVTQGSKTVTGSGTLWAANADAGMLFQRGPFTRVYAVASVDSDTQLTLADPYEAATAAGQAYALFKLAPMAAPYRVAQIYVAAGNRLVTVEGRQVFLSDGPDPNTGVLRPHSFSDPPHELPDGADGLGAAALGDVVFVFTTAGVFAITNVFFDLFDPLGNQQRTLEPVNADIVLWGPTGVATWQDQLVVPAMDGVWLMGSGGPELISPSITPLYVGYVRAGHRPGQATVYKSHYFLPVLSSAGAVVDLLVCRLDRPTRDERRQTIWPWSWLRGHGGLTGALTVRVGGASASRSPRLLSAGHAEGRVLDCSGFFEPSASNKVDADGVAPTWDVETRDFATGTGNLNHVRRVEIRYELVDAASDDPTIEGFISKGEPEDPGSLWGQFLWGQADWSDASLGEYSQLPGTAPEDAGRNPWTWLTAKHTRYARARFRSSDPAAKMALRSLELYVLDSPKDR